jgi:hypothetical protein
LERAGASPKSSSKERILNIANSFAPSPLERAGVRLYAKKVERFG